MTGGHSIGVTETYDITETYDTRSAVPITQHCFVHAVRGPLKKCRLDEKYHSRSFRIIVRAAETQREDWIIKTLGRWVYSISAFPVSIGQPAWAGLEDPPPSSSPHTIAFPGPLLEA